jgi:NAD+ kinase
MSSIYGQYYQNSTEPIIKTSSFFLIKQCGLVIEAAFLEPLWKEIIKKEYKTFFSHTELDQSFDMLISIGGDGTILRAATLIRDSGILY